MEIRRLARGDGTALEAVVPCFDNTVDREAATRFLESDDHHILVAYENNNAVGFVTGAELTRPDKGTEMFLYELAVHEKYRLKGYGTQLVRALSDLAHESTPVMLSWQFSAEN